MDSFAALALSTDPPNEKLLLQKPQRRASPLITFPMWKQIILSGVFQVGITLGLLGIGGRILDSLGVDGSDEGLLRTFIFTVFVMLQVFNEVNCRSVDEDEGGVFAGLWKNPYFIGIIVLTIVGQVSDLGRWLNG
jgi:Ca2+-transporting ATPase